MSALLTIVAVAVGLPGLVAAAHLSILAAASLAYREPRPERVPPVRFLVVVPAHDEEEVIAATLHSIAAARRPGDLLLVVADHCTDATAAIARSAGAEVLERSGGDGGRAAALQHGLRHAEAWEWDAYVSIDADSVIDPRFFASCERVLAASQGAVQARSESLPARGALAHASLAAFSAQGVMVPRGRDRLGLSVRLRGSGMVLTRQLLARHRYRTAGASEDLWMSLDLCLDGVLPRHVDSARLRSQSATTVRAAEGQRVRWESGRLLAAREFVLPLLKARTLAGLEAAVHLVTPPFAVAAFLLLAAAGLGALAGATGVVVVMLGGFVALALTLVVTLVEARVGWRTWGSLVIAPAYVLWKVWVQALAVVRLRSARQAYDRTPRS